MTGVVDGFSVALGDVWSPQQQGYILQGSHNEGGLYLYQGKRFGFISLRKPVDFGKREYKERDRVNFEDGSSVAYDVNAPVWRWVIRRRKGRLFDFWPREVHTI